MAAMTSEVIDSATGIPHGGGMTTNTTTVDSIVDSWLRAYGEPDAATRANLIVQVWAPDGVLADPPFSGTGHAEIDALAGAVLGQYPGHTFRRTSAVDAHHDVARYTWEMVGPDGAVALTGTDVVAVGEDGRLARVAGFFGDPPAA
ncbi:nuclear transport factor 2 family protein [Pseudonocardia xishanensis]|uniref:Nuclear transport factor 2 family protein n=1 Tax=Pseudonocardia xishanensis TaxID=630995 RepID=A0ABP8S4P1_9PSEU